MATLIDQQDLCISSLASLHVVEIEENISLVASPGFRITSRSPITGAGIPRPKTRLPISIHSLLLQLLRLSPHYVGPLS